MVDTAGTSAMPPALKEHGAAKVYAYATHPVLSGRAIENLENSVLDALVVTNTIPLSAAACRPAPASVSWTWPPWLSLKRFAASATKNRSARCSAKRTSLNDKCPPRRRACPTVRTLVASALTVWSI